MYRLFFGPNYGVRECEIDEWTGALRVALRRSLDAICENPLIGQLENPLEGVFAYRVPLFRGRIRVVLAYRVNQMDRTIEMVDIWSEEE